MLLASTLRGTVRRVKAQGGRHAASGSAHKLARMVWHLIKHCTPYDPTVWLKAEEKLRKKKIKRLHQTAAALGYKLICTF
jgi:hypothetical protein